MVVARAGAWLMRQQAFGFQSGCNCIGLGGDHSIAWQKLMRKCGGDFSQLRRVWWKRRWPVSHACYLDHAEVLGELLDAGLEWEAALAGLLHTTKARIVRMSELDANFSEATRVIQCITSIQTGGAERIALGLAEELNAAGVDCGVISLGRPTRESFPQPRAFVDLSEVAQQEKLEAISSAALQWGADLIHAHLIRLSLAQGIKAGGFPLVMTVHNSRPGWPEGMESCDASHADLWIACSHQVACELPKVDGLPTRVVWNGIVPSALKGTSHRNQGMWRNSLRVPTESRVLLCLANPRPQKRMDRLPPIMAALDGVHLWIAGEASFGVPQIRQQVDQIAQQLGVADRIHWLGSVNDVAALLSEVDALISTSDWEGLSLAHLEALAAGLPVVATDVGGTREIAERHPALTLLDAQAAPDVFAAAVRAAFLRRNEHDFPKCFSRYMMAQRTHQLYRRVIAMKQHAPSPERLCLITNNFSMGGAQTSAKRLLRTMKAMGKDVRAAVIQEDPENPTAGRSELIEQGINVLSVMPPDRLESREACEHLLKWLDQQGVGVVIFWNLITSYKLMLTDALLDRRVIDVSPGAMYFRSLDAYFENPRADLPYRCGLDYGRLLSAFVSKYHAESGTVMRSLGVEASVIPNGVPLPEIMPPSTTRQSPMVIATSARISPDKCLEQLFDAFEAAVVDLPRCVLKIAGEAERGSEAYAEDLKKSTLHLPVEWCGAVRDMNAFLQKADFFVMISEPPGCPNALLEAMANGLPVIATDVGGASEQVLDGKNGFLTQAADAGALARAMVRLGRDAQLRAACGAFSRRHAEENFSMERMVKGYLRVIYPEK
jgi:glycosyltransferase involved in cell wall biosynthesis